MWTVIANRIVVPIQIVYTDLMLTNFDNAATAAWEVGYASDIVIHDHLAAGG